MTDNQEVTVNEKKNVEQEESTRPGRTYRPDVDIYETETSVWLRADMPGVDESSVELRVEDDRLTIEGHVDLAEYSELRPVYREYDVGNYFRRFNLSRDVDQDAIRAKVSAGVLEVELPKAEQAKPRRIEVSAA